MSPALLALLGAAAVLVLAGPRRRRGGHRRPRPDDGLPARGLPPALTSVGVPAVAGVATAAWVGGVGGIATGGLVAAAVAAALTGLEPAAERRRREALARQAPLVVDLVAACLASGAPLERSIDVAAGAVGSPTADVLHRATAALRLGADPAAVWSEVATHDSLAPLARAVSRSQQTGAPLATLLPRVADQARAAHRVRVEARIRTAAVRLTAPLGVAFLPAFVLLGVVPVVASWVGALL